MRNGYDAVVVGGGAAGLSAALYLGRARRRALLCDVGEPRNMPSAEAHGLLSRDGAPPSEIARWAREQLAPYETVEVRDAAVERVEPAGDDGFAVTLGDGAAVAARKILLATGCIDELPPVAGLAERWGRGVLHCPYCHGFEVRGRPLAVLGGEADAVRLAVRLTRFSDDIVLCTNGSTELDAENRGLLGLYGIRLNEKPIARLEGRDGDLEKVVCDDGEALTRGALFVHPVLRQRSSIAARLGCAILDDGSVLVDQFQQTSVPGVWAAGDMARPESVPFPQAQLVAAASSGAVAAVALDQGLLAEEVQARAARVRA